MSDVCDHVKWQLENFLHFVCVHVCACMQAHMSMHVGCVVGACMLVFVCACVHAYLWICVYLCARMCVCQYVCLHAYVPVCACLCMSVLCAHFGLHVATKVEVDQFDLFAGSHHT